MASYSIITNPKGQDLLPLVLLHLQVVWFSFDIVGPDQVAVIIQDGNGGVRDSEASRSQKDVVVVVTLRRIDCLSHNRRNEIGRAI